MTPLTRLDVLAHQAHVPWPSPRQAEQDLLFCRAMAAIINDGFIHSQVAMRGGTLLHKVHLAPPSRYSEDIDLVVFGDRPEQHIRRDLRRVLSDVLSAPKTSAWGAITLAIRNSVKPSRVLRTNEVANVLLGEIAKPVRAVRGGIINDPRNLVRSRLPCRSHRSYIRFSPRYCRHRLVAKRNWTWSLEVDVFAHAKLAEGGFGFFDLLFGEAAFRGDLGGEF